MTPTTDPRSAHAEFERQAAALNDGIREFETKLRTMCSTRVSMAVVPPADAPDKEFTLVWQCREVAGVRAWNLYVQEQGVAQAQLLRNSQLSIRVQVAKVLHLFVKKASDATAQLSATLAAASADMRAVNDMLTVVADAPPEVVTPTERPPVWEAAGLDGFVFDEDARVVAQAYDAMDDRDRCFKRAHLLAQAPQLQYELLQALDFIAADPRFYLRRAVALNVLAASRGAL